MAVLSKDFRYKVEEGDTPESIAQKFGTTLDQINWGENRTATDLFVGMPLAIHTQANVDPAMLTPQQRGEPTFGKQTPTGFVPIGSQVPRDVVNYPGDQGTSARGTAGSPLADPNRPRLPDRRSTVIPKTKMVNGVRIDLATGKPYVPEPSPFASSKVTANFPTTNLQPGMTGATVKKLQDYLVSQGYMTQAQVNTGYGTYGPQTTAAVLAMQKKLGIDYSSGPGYFGPKTIAALGGGSGSQMGGGASEIPIGEEEGADLWTDRAADKANKEAERIFGSITQGDIDTRDSSRILSEIEDKIDEAPEPTSLVDLFEQKRRELGVEALEDELAGIDSDIDLINTSLLVEADKAGERLVSMGEINRTKGTLQKNAEREIALKNEERGAVSRMLANKLDTVKTYVDLTDADFDNASAKYSADFNRLTTLQQLVSGEEKEDRNIFERARDTAQTNLTALQNLIVDGGLSYANLSQDQKLKIRALEIQAGLPAGITEQITVENPEGKIQATSSRTDASGNAYYDVLIKNADGSLSVQSVYRGQGGGEDSKTVPASVVKDAKDAQAVINQGADEVAVRQRFLETHPEYGDYFDDYIYGN